MTPPSLLFEGTHSLANFFIIEVSIETYCFNSWLQYFGPSQASCNINCIALRLVRFPNCIVYYQSRGWVLPHCDSPISVCPVAPTVHGEVLKSGSSFGYSSLGEKRTGIQRQFRGFGSLFAVLSGPGVLFCGSINDVGRCLGDAMLENPFFLLD